MAPKKTPEPMKGAKKAKAILPDVAGTKLGKALKAAAAELEGGPEPQAKAAKTLKKPAAASSASGPAPVDTPATRADAFREPAGKPPSKAQELINAIHRTIASIPYHAAPAVGVRLHPVALTSLDASGFPSTRSMIPNFVAPDLTEVRMATRRGTRKEAEIAANPKVSLHFQDQRGCGGWATLKGEAKLLPGATADEVNIVVRPERIEVMSDVEGAMADEDGWKPAVLMQPSHGDSWRRVH